MGQILLNDLLGFSEEEIKNEHEIMQSIEKHRKSLGYKQYEFAEMMGLTPVQYSKIKVDDEPYILYQKFSRHKRHI